MRELFYELLVRNPSVLLSLDGVLALSKSLCGHVIREDVQ